MNNLPIIRLEVDQMKYTVLAALSEHAAKMDSYIMEAVENYCSEENIKSVVEREAQKCIDMAVKEEIRHFFQGTKAGRAAIREAVIEHFDYIDKYKFEE